MTDRLTGCLWILCMMLLLSVNSGWAQNPLIMGQFTADPTARVFEGRVYVYPSHDILAGEGRGRPGWFCMPDHHVSSSADLAVEDDDRPFFVTI